MALLKSGLEVLRPHIKGSVLSLGYPDIYLNEHDLHDLFGIEVNRFNVITNRPESVHVFKLLGAELKTLDSVRQRESEDVVDLDFPQVLGKFDLVIDPGTIEHCFNIGQAILNAANAVKVGGHIFHSPPISMVNHGFYCVCPTLLHDFYKQNGWEVEVFRIVDSKGNTVKDNFDHVQRVSCTPELSSQFLAKRTNDNFLRFPRQTKYGGR